MSRAKKTGGEEESPTRRRAVRKDEGNGMESARKHIKAPRRVITHGRRGMGRRAKNRRNVAVGPLYTLGFKPTLLKMLATKKCTLKTTVPTWALGTFPGINSAWQ